MDVSPQALRAVTFRERLRGYHPEDVDRFLERVAEGVTALQGQLDQALARAEKAEADRAVAGESEDAVKRTLTLAQRTADLALKEAKEEAARLIADGQATADQIAEDAQRQLRTDLERLDAARKQLHDDVMAMQQYVEQERTRARTILAELVRKVDSTTRRPPPPPTPSTLDIPARGTRPPGAEPVREPTPAPVPVTEAPAPVRQAEVVPPPPVVPAPPAEPPPPVRREPQPPPVSGTPFGVTRPAAGKPSGPPPGPKRQADQAQPDRTGDADEGLDIRGLFGR